jgi:aldose sugar dehydrogenase
MTKYNLLPIAKRAMTTASLLVVFVFASLTGCANANKGAIWNNTDSLPPVETKSPNSDYKPAFAGQTRIAGAKTNTPYTVDKIADKLGHPFAIVAMPDGRLMVTIKSGYMEIHDKNGELVKRIAGFPPVVYAGQGGLLDVAFDPNFSSNKILYWCYSEAYSGANLTAVAKGKLDEAGGRVEEVSVIFRAAPGTGSTLQYGSRLAFDKNGYLFVSIGEKFMPQSRVEAQDLGSYLGKIVRITTDGKPAPGNPYLNQPGVKPEIYSYGHRNPEGLDIDPVTGESSGRGKIMAGR